MLLPKQTLSAEARKRFALPFANPFDGEVTSDAEMFVNGEIRFVRESAWQAAIGGRFCAIVGESGAGKTTITNLINRFYDIQKGTIEYDGIDVTHIHKDDLRASLGKAPAHPPRG